jgi:hypothetical protein
MGLLPAEPAFAASSVDERATADAAKDKMICKRSQRTGTRFYSKVCKTAGQWEAQAEQHKRDASELINRPQVEIRRE